MSVSYIPPFYVLQKGSGYDNVIFAAALTLSGASYLKTHFFARRKFLCIWETAAAFCKPVAV